MRNETSGAVFKKQQFITVCYSTCVRIEMKQEGQFSKTKQKTPIYYSMLFNLYAYWNETRGTVFKKIQLMTICYKCAKFTKRGSFQKTTIYYSMLFNLCAYYETRGTVFKKNKKHIWKYAIQQEGQFSKNNNNCMIFTVIQQEGQFSKKNNNLLQCAIHLVCVLKWNKRGSFQKNPIDDNMLLNSCAKWNKRGSFQKTTIYYCMLFNLCAYWNETRGTVFKKKKQFITVCYSTRGAVFKKQQFITVCYSTCVRIEMKQEGQFSKTKQKTPIYYSMLFNLYAYWNETRWTVFKKIQLMTICY